MGIVCAGTSRYAAEESRDQLRSEYGLETSYLRLKAYPFTPELLDFVRRHERVYVVDQNRDAQLLALMRLEFDAEPDRSVCAACATTAGCRSMPARVTEEIVRQEGL